MLMENLPRALAAAAFSILFATKCSESPRPPDVPFLSSDFHFAVGGQHIVIPAVAMRGPGHVFDLSGRKAE
jgi:hypothetical protein